VDQEAYDGCWGLLKDDFPRAYQDGPLDVYYFYPSRFTWRQDDREVVCISLYLDDKRVGSLLEEGNYPTVPRGDSDV
jgi:hypothetical protein